VAQVHKQLADTMLRFVTGELIFARLIKKLSAFYGTRLFITVFTTARHWPTVHNLTSHLFKDRLHLPSHFRVAVKLSLPFRCFPTSLISSCVLQVLPSHRPFNIWCTLQSMQLLPFFFTKSDRPTTCLQSAHVVHRT